MKIRIALVEDDVGLRQLVIDWLGRENDMQVVAEFGDTETAVTQMASHKPDVVLVDINLPKQNGIECVRQLKPLLPTAQFVMVTMYEDTDLIFQALTAGATGYLLKRSVGDELAPAIREVHAGGSPMSGQIARKVVQCFHSPISAVPVTAVLTEREKQVLKGLVEGQLYKEIADVLGCGMGSINTFVRRIYEKLHIHSRKEAIEKFRKDG
jgi:DNA-binding NarL/FixJ family response regulator